MLGERAPTPETGSDTNVVKRCSRCLRARLGVLLALRARAPSCPSGAAPEHLGSMPRSPRVGLRLQRRLHALGPQRRWQVLVGLFALLALVAVFTNAPGWYIADNRFEQYWSPGRVLSRTPWLWDASRGMGRPRGEINLLTGAVLALVRGLGVSPAATERLWHATLLAGAATGLVLFLRVFRPRLGLEHVIAGLLYGFNPYSAVFLIPSGLFVNYAIAPWLLLAAWRGSTEARPWRWAAAFALLILASGSTDPPGVLYALVLLLPVALYLVLVERRVGWGPVAGWLARAGLLSLVVSGATLIQLFYGADALSARLFGTESVDALNQTSSWAESWRGLGFWISYFPIGERLLRPHHAAYFDSAPVILATFAAPLAALAVLAWSRWRPRLLMVGLTLVSVTAMVGSYPSHRPFPLGGLLLDAYERLPALAILRTSYKAGAGLALGVSCLVGVGVAAATTALTRSRSRWRLLPAGVTLALVGVASFPFWTGHLYPPVKRMGDVPEHWVEAIAWLDAQPRHSRVLILPGTATTRYRWGSPGDDLFDALLGRPHLIRTSLPLGTAQASNLVHALDDRIQSGRYEPGTLAPIARRLGVEHVVIRNDLDWQALDRARPGLLQPLRDDPELELVARFGEPGELVVAPGDASAAARAEAELPPVEIYRVRDAERMVRVVPAHAPLLVSGDGHAWFSLAARQLLDDARTIRYTGDTSPDALARHLAEGSSLVVSDTNRRLVTLVTGSGQAHSHTLATGEDLDRPAGDLFSRPGSQTVAFFEDATTIASASTGSSVSGFDPAARPANAFDGDELTSWSTGALTRPLGRSVVVELKQPTRISAVDLVRPELRAAGRFITDASVVLSDGSTFPVDLAAGRARVSFPPRTTTSLEVRIDAVAGPGLGPVGLSEVVVAGLDLAEIVQVPDDVFRAAERHPALQSHLEEAAVTYQFERVDERGTGATEPSLRRRFRTLGNRDYLVEGLLAVPAEGRASVAAAVGAGGEASTPPTCLEGVLAVDGEDVPVRLAGSVEAVLAGRPVPFESCVPVAVPSGWHRFDSGRSMVVERATLSTGRSGETPEAEDGAPVVRVLEQNPSKLRLEIQAPAAGAVLLSGRSYDPAWTASVQGLTLGSPQALDTQASWLVPGGSVVVDVEYGPQRIYSAALVVTLVGMVACLWLVTRRSGRRGS